MTHLFHKTPGELKALLTYREYLDHIAFAENYAKQE